MDGMEDINLLRLGYCLQLVTHDKCAVFVIGGESSYILEEDLCLVLLLETRLGLLFITNDLSDRELLEKASVGRSDLSYGYERLSFYMLELEFTVGTVARDHTYI